VIVVEPTELNVAVAHKGVIRWKANTIGRAAHSSRPDWGANAIYGMARLVSAIEQYSAKLTAGRVHPLCGPATVSVGTIHGGVGVNTVPDRCAIEIDFRPIPGDPLDEAKRQFMEFLLQTELGGIAVEHETPFLYCPPLSDEHNGRLAEQICAAVRDLSGECRVTGMPGCTDAPFYAAAGIPCVVFGPGSLDQAHTADEWLSLDELHRGVDVFDRLCRTFCDPEGS
jgi:acetylornithine deacetylase/succinyl-diaminopimelate desuccinylase-like protein